VRFLKQAEIFAFLAAIFLIGVVIEEKKVHDNPPLIILSEENEAYSFRLGSAAIPDTFRTVLHHRIIPLLDSLTVAYACDAVDVIGHTDESAVQSDGKDFDELVVDGFVRGNIENLIPGSNTDLGMMRALSIIAELVDSKRTGHLEHVQYFFPYSAGHMVRTNHLLTRDYNGHRDASRRRIEIRIFKQATRRIE
jgi:hypothetical protein